jgi:hypothetical protein
MSDPANIQKAQPLRRCSAKEWIMNKRLEAVAADMLMGPQRADEA